MRVLLAAALAGYLLPEAAAFSSSFTPMLRTGPSTGLMAMQRRQPQALVGLRMQQGLSPEEQKEYEALLERSQQMKQQFENMITGALAGMDDEEEEEEEAPVAVAEPEFTGKGFNIPMTEEDDDEPDEYDPGYLSEEEIAALSEEERYYYMANMAKERGEVAFEACEDAIASGNLKKARELHEVAKKEYYDAGMTKPGSMSQSVFAEAFATQREKCYPVKVKGVDPVTKYAKSKMPWDV